MQELILAKDSDVYLHGVFGRMKLLINKTLFSVARWWICVVVESDVTVTENLVPTYLARRVSWWWWLLWLVWLMFIWWRLLFMFVICRVMVRDIQGAQTLAPQLSECDTSCSMILGLVHFFWSCTFPFLCFFSLSPLSPYSTLHCFYNVLDSNANH